MTRWSLVGSLAMALACGGLFADRAGLEQVRQALGVVAPDSYVAVYAQAMSEVRLVGPRCGEGLAVLQALDPDQREAIVRHLLDDPIALCPAVCGGSDLLPSLAPMDPAERTRAALTRCDAEGPDPVFGDLAGLRTGMAALEYVLFRSLQERAESVVPSFADQRVPLAVGLVVAGTPELVPTDVVAMDGTFTPPPGVFTALADTLRTCPSPHLRHRLVIAPGGAVQAVSGGTDPCVAKALAALQFPTAPGWSFVDVTWTVPPAVVP